ncbi:MAG: alcohol dehydrogenase catalytic domain-containing protein, partial [Myxococcales bacterium]|nr:alcohol dehydrogenase catalytic domain-containing protein [Myxococcales bacterium]
MKARAITVHETGGANVLQLETRELPAPGAGEVQLRVSAIGVNFIDVYFRTGLYPRPLPFVPGLEGAGVIERLGPDVEALEPGARVAWASVPGSYAERLIARAADLVRIPDAVSDTLAAAVMLQGMTAHYLAHGTRSTRPGDVALVHAAAGGTGLLLVQQLKAAGATVLGT